MTNSLDVEMYEQQIVPMGIDVVDFITPNAIYIRLEVINKSKNRTMPIGLVDNIAKLIKEYKEN